MSFQKNISPLELLQKAQKKNEWSPTYFFYGEETFLRDRCLSFLKQNLLSEEEAEMNCRQFYCSESSLEDIASELETLPFFALRKFVVIHDVELLKDKDWERIEPLLPKESESLVVLCLANKTDKRKKIFKHLFDKTTALEMKPPYENQLSYWIRSLCNEKGKEIGSDAIGLIHRKVGSRLTDLNSEIEKLVDFVGERSEISSEDVSEVVVSSKTESIFELTDALGRRRFETALMLLKNLMEDGQSELGMIAMIARHFRILLLLKDGMEKEYSGSTLAQYAGVPPYFVQQYQEQVRHWNQESMMKALYRVSQTEKLLKSSGSEPAILMDSMIFQIERDCY